MSWSKKYKKSIDCSNVKGFSQKAHCAGRKKRQKGYKTQSKSVNEMEISELKDKIRELVEAKRGRGIKTIQSDIEKNNQDIKKALDFYIKNKETDKAKAFVDVLKKLNKRKHELASELDAKIAGMYKDAELKGPAPFKGR